MNFSASDLIKRSAKQICFLRTLKSARSTPPSKEKLMGNKLHIKKATSKYLEMRGIYQANNVTVFYCFDEVKLKPLQFIEHKMVLQDSEEWYLQQSILQVAFYAALHELNENKWLNTASFFKGESNKLYINKPVESILKFGKKTYKIKVIRPKQIVTHFIKKALASLSYESAIAWDAKYKHLDWKNLQKCVKLIPI